MEDKIKEIIKSANRLHEAEVSEYLDLCEAYLESFVELMDELEKSENSGYRSLIEELKEAHDKAVERGLEFKDKVKDDLGELQKRAIGIRRYIDKAPSRITITGRRKG